MRPTWALSHKCCRWQVTLVLGGLLGQDRSEEHTSELQSHLNLVCRLLLEKKKANRHPPQSDLLRDAISAVNNVWLIAANDDVSRLCASFVLRRDTLRTHADRRPLRARLLS